MKRIMIVGAPGSGKSTLARELGDITKLPVQHMDRIHHEPGWVQRPLAERIRMATEVENSETWIFEGGLSRTYDHRAARADLIIWLDLPLGLRLFRVVWRTLRGYGRTRPDMQDDCPEHFSWEFYSYILRTNKMNRARIIRLLAETTTSHVHLNSRRAVSDWLRGAREKGISQP